MMQSARPVNQTPLFDKLAGKGGIFGQIGCWERAFWFDRDKATHNSEGDPYGHLSFHDDEPWRQAVQFECETVRDHVGIMDHGGFTKFEVAGPGAANFLDYVFCGTLPNPGRVRLSYMLTPNGRLWSEATIARLELDRFLLCGPTLAIDRDFDCLQAHLPDDDSVSLCRGSSYDGALMVMGPKSRELLQSLTNTDLSATSQSWMSVSELKVAGIKVIAMRVSYVGELGWELHVPSNDLEALYNAIWQEGQTHQLCDFGSYALNSMRVEKCYHGWGSDFGTEYTPFDSGLDRFVAFNKGEFVGRDALMNIRQSPPEWSFWGFEITDSNADALPSDPVFIDGELAGYITSATTGFRTHKRLALGYIQQGKFKPDGHCEIEILGKRRSAIIAASHFYDPENERLKS